MPVLHSIVRVVTQRVGATFSLAQSGRYYSTSRVVWVYASWPGTCTVPGSSIDPPARTTGYVPLGSVPQGRAHSRLYLVPINGYKYRAYGHLRSVPSRGYRIHSWEPCVGWPAINHNVVGRLPNKPEYALTFCVAHIPCFQQNAHISTTIGL